MESGGTFRFHRSRRRRIVIASWQTTGNNGVATINERKHDGTSNHGSGKSAAVRGRTAAFQQRPGKSDDFAPGPLRRAGRHLAGPGTREVLRGIQAGDEGIEEIRGTLESAHALPVAKGPAHRGISQPALKSWLNAPKSLPSKPLNRSARA